MLTREELLSSSEYWFEYVQNDIYRIVTSLMENESLNQTQLAQKLGVSKGYVSQILKGEFNYSLKKLIDLSISVGYVPHIEFKSLNEVIDDDKKTKVLKAEGSFIISQELQFYSMESKEVA